MSWRGEVRGFPESGSPSLIPADLTAGHAIRCIALSPTATPTRPATLGQSNCPSDGPGAVPEDKDKDRREAKRARARSSPVRARMLDLYEADPNRSMELRALFEKLKDEGWDVTVAQVHYHLLILIDAELVCRPKHSG